MSSSAGNVNQNARLSLTNNLDDPRMITKTHSASNVFSRTSLLDNSRNSLNSTDNYKVQYNSNSLNNNFKNEQFKRIEPYTYGVMNENSENCNSENGEFQDVYKNSFSDVSSNSEEIRGPKLYERFSNIRRGSSVENVISDVNLSGNLKKVKFENEVYKILVFP